MKIWKSFSADHSAKLKIIGTFKNNEDAELATILFNELIDVDEKELEAASFIDGKLKEIVEKYHFYSFNENDPEQMLYFGEIEANENVIIVETDELDIQSIIKIFLKYSAKIKIFSKHDYS